VEFNDADFHVLDRELVDTSQTFDVSPNEFALRVVARRRVIKVTTQSSRVAPWACARVAILLRSVLEAMAADPETEAWRSCVPVAERWHAAGDVVAVPQRCLRELFEQQVARAPEAAAVTWSAGGMTYAQLDRDANGLAVRLLTAGVRPEEPVGVLLDRSPELLVALLGVLKAGAAYLPIEIGSPAPRVAAMLADAGVRRCLVGAGPRADLSGVDSMPVVLDAPAGSAVALPRRGEADDLAAVYFTSGSAQGRRLYAPRLGEPARLDASTLASPARRHRAAPRPGRPREC
jgi:non-ribosomal peptide synthetase component F